MNTWLYKEHAYATYVAIYCRSDLNKADLDAKAYGGVDITREALVHSWI